MGEPINPEAWQWYYTVVGEKRCPIVDTFWQTETVSPDHLAQNAALLPPAGHSLLTVLTCLLSRRVDTC